MREINTNNKIDIKKMWFAYFNQVLFENGILTEKEKRIMDNLVHSEIG